MKSLHFLWPLSGGLMIGLSATFYLVLNGRVAGISGLTAAAASAIIRSALTVPPVSA